MNEGMIGARIEAVHGSEWTAVASLHGILSAISRGEPRWGRSVVECICISGCVIMLRLPANSQPFVVPWFRTLPQVLASILAGASGW